MGIFKKPLLRFGQVNDFPVSLATRVTSVEDALGQACVDLVFQTAGSEALQARIEERNAERVLKYGEEIGLGSRDYVLVTIDP